MNKKKLIISNLKIEEKKKFSFFVEIVENENE